MTVWTGQNWQLIDADDPQAMIGVTFGIGLLDEEVEAAGTLSIALDALRTELARPIELGNGLTFVPEVSVELGTDTATLALRGSLEGISAAWRRLPELFRAGTVTEGTMPLRPESSPWPADLLRRTGHNAAALAWLQTTAADAHDRAAALLPRLNPSSGLTPAACFTTAESLVGLSFPVETDDGAPAPRMRWADGTSARTASDRDFAALAGTRKGVSTRLDDSLGSSPTSNNHVLLSAMVTRSASGLIAAGLLTRQLSAIAGSTIGYKEGMGLEVCGAGAAFHVVVLSETRIPESARHKLLREAGKSMGLIPDSWIDDALIDAHRTLTPRLERERRLMGLAAEQAMTAAELRRSINDAVHSLEVNFIPASAGLDNTNQAEREGQTKGQQQVFKSRVGRIVHDGRAQTWDPSAPPPWISSLVVDQGSIRIGGWQPGHGRRAKITEGVGTAAAVAVLEDQAGTLVIVDDQLRTLTVQPALFHQHEKLLQALDGRLAGVPRLVVESTVDAEKLQRHIRRSKRAKIWPLAAVAAVIAIVVGANIINISADPAVTERVAMDHTVRLHNGTEITVWGLDAAPGIVDGPLDLASVQVKFCAGTDTEAGELPPETQRSVSAGDFMAFNDNQGYAELVDSDKQLRESTLREGQCATGDLVFSATQLDNPRVVYKNEVGDDVIWYPYGESPQG